MADTYTTESTSFTLSGISVGAILSIKMRAVMADGGVTADSESVVIQILEPPDDLPNVPNIPIAPALTSLQAGINAKVTAVRGARKYIFKYDRGWGNELHEQFGSLNPFFIAASPGQHVIVRVLAKNESGFSGYSAPSSATVAVPLPSAPTGFSVAQAVGGFITSWNSQPNDTTITLRFSLNGERRYRFIRDLTGVSTKIPSGPGDSIEVRAKAVNAFGDSAWTEKKTATKPTNISWPSNAELNVAYDVTGKTWRAEWPLVNNAAGYVYSFSGIVTVNGQASPAETSKTCDALTIGPSIKVEVALVDKGGSVKGRLTAASSLLPSPPTNFFVKWIKVGGGLPTKIKEKSEVLRLAGGAGAKGKSHPHQQPVTYKFIATWNAPSESSVIIAYKLSGDSTFKASEPSVSPFVVEGLAGYSFTAKVKAVNEWGASSWTSERRTTILTPEEPI
ncbi:MAG: hypothetical protein ACPGWR_01005 [Ardenticatenaceae bacterium]